MSKRYICIHGHFYQPPRENPWLEAIEKQDSAEPFHDWNARICAECYHPNSASRIVDEKQQIIDLINNYAKISFNFGPTLLSWMEQHATQAYDAIVAADRESQVRFSGHGSAIAQVYNHMIMPLANAADKITQVKWGLKDFEHRFGRMAEGMWLAEAAVDLESLDVLAEHGVRYTILAPRQAARIRKLGTEDWQDVTGTKIDPRRAYVCRLPSGRSINLFFYDGPVAQDIAFGGLLKDGNNLAERLYGVFGDTPEHESQLVHVATDGESYGHHHRFGDMALAFALYRIEQEDKAELTVYGEFLDKVAVDYEVEIYENSSWSCAHGVERWRSDCGCNTGGAGWHQKWRAPLREALDLLRDTTQKPYEQAMTELGADPWAARNEYISVMLDRSEKNLEHFFKANFSRKLKKDEKVVALKLLELQKNAMFMYTSCGWFFDEISGIEPVQLMQYAAGVMQTAQDVLGLDLEKKFLAILKKAPSNLKEFKSGADVYEKYVRHGVIGFERLAVHYGLGAMFEAKEKVSELYAFEAEMLDQERAAKDDTQVFCGTVALRSRITHEEKTFAFFVVDSGGFHVQCGATEFKNVKTFTSQKTAVFEAFSQSAEKALAVIGELSGGKLYTLKHLFSDERHNILSNICMTTLVDVEKRYRQVFEEKYEVMRLIRDSGLPLPPVFARTIEFVLSNDIVRLLIAKKLDFTGLKHSIEEIKRWAKVLDKKALTNVTEKMIARFVNEIDDEPENRKTYEFLCAAFRLIQPLELQTNIWNAQNIYFRLSRDLYPVMEERAGQGDMDAGSWLSAFDSLAPFLKVK